VPGGHERRDRAPAEESRHDHARDAQPAGG
jgi:hypothetical protein